MQVFINAIGLRGPGLEGWSASRPVLAGLAAYHPQPTILPPAVLLPANERRRAPETVRLAMDVGMEAFTSLGLAPVACPTVFASSGGDGKTIHDILQTLASPVRDLSPTRFHNSVHNVAAGYWSIATGARTPATSLCAHDASFAAGFLEAATQALVVHGPVALIAYDLPYPQPLASVRPIGDAFAVALVLSAQAQPHSLARVQLSLEATTPTPCSTQALEALRHSIPAARALPLLEGMARLHSEAGTGPMRIVVEYLPDLAVLMNVTPL